MKKYKFILKNLDCANCANKIQNKLSENQNYRNVVVNFNTLRLSFESELEYEVVKKEIIEEISKLEPEVVVLDFDDHKNSFHNHENEHEHIHEYNHEEHESYCDGENCEHDKREFEHKQESNEKKRNSIKINSNLIRLIIGIILMIIGVYVSLPNYLNLIFTILAYTALLFRTTKNAIKLLSKKTIDENFLVTISCIGAYFVGQQEEGLMVIILYEIGKLLEEKAINNTRKSISDLMDIRPEYANLKHGNHEHKVNPYEVNIGDIIIIKQGEKVPLDGIVVSGKAFFNTSYLTGESNLKEVKENDSILSGSINENGLIELKVTEKYENSTVSKILELVENATDKKTKTETFVNKASRIYTPIVIILAIIVAVFLPLVSSVTYANSIYRALIFLVISCPCAIVISIPLSYFSGIGKASKKGILIKGSNILDAIKDINVIAFDKTGTLTKGEFSVEKIKVYTKEYSEEQVLEYAAIGEYKSNHPIATAIMKKYNKKIDSSKITNFKEISGKGLSYNIEEKKIKVGNNELVEVEKEQEIGTIIYVEIDNKVIGYLVLNDTIKSEAKETIKGLNSFGIKTMMFTGDNSEIAQKVASEIGIDVVKSQMLPTDKYGELEKIIKENQKGKVAFVGDGINDSPVLALSDIGISMGGIGASSAIEASDVVIMTDDLNKISDAIKISKVTNGIIKQNLMFAILVKVFVLLLSVIGLAQMWMAVFADVGVTLITILNTIRILRRK